MRAFAWRLLVICLLLIPPATGCQLNKRATWHAARIVVPNATGPFTGSSLATAETALAEALNLESRDCEACVDSYFYAAVLTLPEVMSQLDENSRPVGRAADIHHSALSKLVDAGQRYRRFVPGQGLQVNTVSGSHFIPARFHGFHWQPSDFDRLIPAGDYTARDLLHHYRCEGIGVATVVVRQKREGEPFRQPQQVFPATLVLNAVGGGKERPLCPFVLDFFDPLRISSTEIEGCGVQICRDLSAPVAWRMSTVDRDYLRDFLHPGSTSQDLGLFMLEPFQPGRIPLVFVHGLLSDRLTWVSLANEIIARPELLDRYQIWGFEYSTGEPFLAGAELLRRQLQEVQQQFDPDGRDPALRQTVLVGHSMGGLVSKLQVTSSGTQLWDSICSRPLESLQTTEEVRGKLASSFFFEPSPLVSRVIFVGTPHRGSPWAQRPVGRLGSSLVEEPATMEAVHSQLVCDNPGVFSREFSGGIPTSIDVLNPDSGLLQAIDRLPVAPGVHLHTIAGSGYWMRGAGDSDSVVPLSSSVHFQAESEKIIHAKHGKLHQAESGIDELLSILQLHAAQSGLAGNR